MKTQNLQLKVLGLLSLLLLTVSLLTPTAYGMEFHEFTREGECWAEAGFGGAWQEWPTYYQVEAVRVSCDLD